MVPQTVAVGALAAPVRDGHVVIQNHRDADFAEFANNRVHDFKRGGSDEVRSNRGVGHGRILNTVSTERQSHGVESHRGDTSRD